MANPVFVYDLGGKLQKSMEGSTGRALTDLASGLQLRTLMRYWIRGRLSGFSTRLGGSRPCLPRTPLVHASRATWGAKRVRM